MFRTPFVRLSLATTRTAVRCRVPPSVSGAIAVRLSWARRLGVREPAQLCRCTRARHPKMQRPLCDTPAMLVIGERSIGDLHSPLTRLVTDKLRERIVTGQIT